MRYFRSSLLFIVSIYLFIPSIALPQEQEKKDTAVVADRPTTFRIFNMGSVTTYNITKNLSPLASTTSSFFGVLSLSDVASQGDQYVFVPDGSSPQPPSVPTGFTASGSDSGCAHISWNPNPENDMAGYTIYFDSLSVERGEISNYRDSVEVAIVTSSHLCGFSDGTYFFTIRARNVWGLYSQPAGEAVADISNFEPTEPPLPPQNVTASETSPGCITVNWDANGEIDLEGYVVYYGSQSVAGGQTPAYADTINVGNVTSKEICNFDPGSYYFAVKAYNASGDLSGFSAERSVVIAETDNDPPIVAITAPSEGTVISGAVTITANASDNVGVAGVQFQVDGIDTGEEDTAVPYELAFSSTPLSDGPHTLTAIARDAAGNTATSTGISIWVDNDANPDQVLLGGGILDRLREKACVDANGNPLDVCSPAPEWTTYSSFIANYVTTGNYPGMQAWHFALMYRVTKNIAFAERAISLLESEISNGMERERANAYETAHEYLRDAALIYDWLELFLDSSQKSMIRDYVNQLVTEIWDPAGNMFYTWSGEDTNNSGSYRYYRFLLGTCYAGLAIDDDNPTPPTIVFGGSSYQNLVDFVLARLDEQAFPAWLDSNGKGGGWHEGEGRGVRAKLAMMDVFSILNAAGKKDYFASSQFPTEAFYFHLYSIQPGHLVRYPGGDLSDDPTGAITADDRHLMQFFASELTGNYEKQYAQFWLNNGPSFEEPKMFAWEFILTDSGRPQRDLSYLNLGYHASGAGWVNSRTGWDDGAISLSFVSADHVLEDQHLDQNSFVIYRNDWQAADAASFSQSGRIPATDGHNTILVNGTGQRTGEGTGAVQKYEISPQYGYMVGDASDAYYLGDKNAGGQRLIEIYQREVVHIHPDYVVITDRITPADSSATVTYLLNTGTAPVINGKEISAVNGSGKIFQRTVWPEDVRITSVELAGGAQGMNSWRTEVQPAAPAAHTIFLHVLYPTYPDVNMMPNTEAVATASNNMVGVKIDAGEEDLIILFSNAPDGAPIQDGILYEVSMTGSSEHLLAGLLPDTGYSVTANTFGTIQSIFVTRGGNHRSSTEGVLRFRLDSSVLPIEGIVSRR